MCVKMIVLVAMALSTSATAFQSLFPVQNTQTTFWLKTNVSTRVVSPEHVSFWSLEGRLRVQVYDEFNTARFHLEDIKSEVQSNDGNSSIQSEDAARYFSKPWEVGICFTSIRTISEPIWVTNIKRALSFNFLLSEPSGSPSTSEEPCLYGNCVTVYSRIGKRIRKYTSMVDYRRKRLSSYEQRCLPNRSAESWYRPMYPDDPNFVLTSERVYEVDNATGLQLLQLNSDFQYRTHDHVLAVSTDLSLRFENTFPVQHGVQKLNLTEITMQYVSHNSSNPTNGIQRHTQKVLKNKTYEILLKIARKGIDADNIVRNASLIHSLDFINLLKTMSQLDYPSLSKLFEDVLGTSYELETSRNIFLEVLPYARTDASARLIRHLVIEQKAKIEDATLVSLIRKLPYNVVEYSRSLLEELEVLTKLGPDFPLEIRHAGILSFATLVYRTMEASFDQQYYDEIYDKYLRMYNYCPQYSDRLVWLQGLTNIGKSVVNYLDEIHTDKKKDRHERLWAALASLNIWRGSTLENTLPTIMDEEDHIQLRIVSLHAFLSSPMGARDFLNVHNYIQRCNNNQLKRFWYTTVKSIENNRFYNRYKSASYYIPFIVNQVSSPGLSHWATTNYIISQEPSLDVQGPTFQLLTAGGAWSGAPELIVVEFSTGGDHPYNAALYIVAEGVSSNLFQRFQNFNATERYAEELLSRLKEMRVEVLKPEKVTEPAPHYIEASGEYVYHQVHIDIIVKIYDKTVYAAHIDQTRFEKWNVEDLKKSIEDFVRFGSHINQQMVYYPIQVAKDFPTEIGTPIRLRSTIVSFASIRGNLTAPFTEDLMWRNDLHIRYQGTSVTSLSTDGPLHPSEHTARIQQSMVVHLPIKFDVKFSLSERSLELKWTNPAQNGGIAMHSRTQISTDTDNGRDIQTVSAFNKHKDEVGGFFFDCECPMSGAEISQFLIARNYNFLTSLQPSQLILNTLSLINSQTAGSCGFILPPRQLQTGNKLVLMMRVDEFVWDEDDEDISKPQEYRNYAKLKVSYGLSYYRDSEESGDKKDFFVVKGSTRIESDGAVGGIYVELISTRPDNSTDWMITLEERHTVSSDFDVDFSDIPTSYNGHVHTNVSIPSLLDEPSIQLVVDFKSRPLLQDGSTRRHWEFHVGGQNIPKLELENQNFNGEAEIIRIWNYLNRQLHKGLISLVEIKDDNGLTYINLNGTNIKTMKSDSFSWVPDSWTSLQILRKLGFYHECLINDSAVTTFSGSEFRMDASGYSHLLAVGDCIETPRFAVILSEGGSAVTLYSGGDFTMHLWPPGQPRLVAYPADEVTRHLNDFRVTTDDQNNLLLRSKLTGVYMLRKSIYETVILVPQAYMGTACGACMGQNYVSYRP